MSVTKILGFDVEAEVLGGMAEVSWNELEGMTIRGLTLQQAWKVLNHLSTGVIDGASKAPESAPVIAALKQVLASEASAPGSTPLSTAAVPGGAPALDARPSAADVSRAAARHQAERAQQQAADEAPEPITTAAAPQQVSDELVTLEMLRGGAIPNDVRTASKLGVVLGWLYEGGFAARDELVAAMQACVPHVECVRRLEDRLEQRVDSYLAKRL